jgi:enoyl-CoA hydratase/carnithine racemase
MTGLHVATVGAVATLAFDAPERCNALTPSLLVELARTVRKLSVDDALRAVVLRGRGNAPFSSGYDLGALPDGPVSAEAARGIHAPIRAAAEALLECRHPVVAAVRGVAFGAAVELVLSCDIRVASDDARFCVPTARWGLLYSYEGIRRFVETVGLSHATSLLLLGEVVPASRAYEIGLIHRVTRHDQFDTELEAVLKALTGGVPVALRETKALLQRARWDAQPGTAFLDHVYARIGACLSQEESRARRRARRASIADAPVGDGMEATVEGEGHRG